MEENIIDLSKVFFGVEEYLEIDDRGLEHNIIEVYPYLLKCYYECENNGIYLFLNLETFEQLYIDYSGNVLDYGYSSKEDIIKISGIHSFLESAQILLNNFEEYGIDNSESVIDFDMARALLSSDEECKLDKSCINSIVNSALTIYQLCYGNPISHESKMKCLYKYYNSLN